MILIIKKRNIQVACLFIWRGREKVFQKKQCFGIGGKEEKAKKADLNSFEKKGSTFNESHSVTLID